MIGEIINIGGDAFILAVTGVFLFCRGRFEGDGREKLDFWGGIVIILMSCLQIAYKLHFAGIFKIAFLRH